jgi:hypothetical protein
MSFKIGLVAWFESKVERSIIYFSVVVGLTETFGIKSRNHALSNFDRFLALSGGNMAIKV